MKKTEREKLKQKFGGHCAYSGTQLGERWHADHFEPLYCGGYGDEPPKSERNTLENMMPACAPCNIDKATYCLEDWRKKLENGPDVLMRNSPAYRHSVRFRLLEHPSLVTRQIKFFFERQK